MPQVRTDPAEGRALSQRVCSKMSALLHASATHIPLRDESVDLILTDPPYNISHRNGRSQTTIGKIIRKPHKHSVVRARRQMGKLIRDNDGSSYREIRRDFGEWDHDWEPAPFLEEARRILRPGGALVAFLSEFIMADYLASGLEHRGLLYWRKSNPAPNFRKQIVRSVEMAVWQTKGGGWTFNEGGYRPNIWDGPLVGGFYTVNAMEPRVHPTQKPLWLMRTWIELFSNPGDVVCDPFMGSGSTVRAAVDCGRRGVGFDIDPQWIRHARRRLQQQVLAL